MKDTIIPILILIAFVVLGVVVLTALDAKQKTHRETQQTHLQECLERTTDIGWCYRRAYNLNLEI